ncbi:MAG: NAD-dependent epimerase/dehydratase [Acidimicrobiaceae bacterium]|nr:NAD-dependent epimerase/dehydratase [Acidimicrobiaceae bacterium]
MRALVSGGAGFLGSGLVDRLLAEGHAVEVLDDLSTGSLANLSEARASGGALRFHQLDVREAECVELITRLRPEVVFHLAARSGDGLARPHLDAEVNLLGTLRVLEGARAAGSRKIVLGVSSAIYGDLDEADPPANEHLALRPSTPHGVAEKAAVDYLSVYRERHGLEFSALALGSVYGPRRLGTADPGALAAFVADLAATRPCALEGDGSQARDYLYVDDAVDAFSRASGRGSGLLLNVATGRETTLLGLLDLLGTLTGTVPAVRQGAARPGSARRSALDPSRAEIHLGWRSWTSLEEGAAMVLEAAGLGPSAARLAAAGAPPGRARRVRASS